MTTHRSSNSLRLGLLTLMGAVSLGLVSQTASANPIAKPTIEISTELPVKVAGKHKYVLVMGKKQTVVEAKTIKVVRPGDAKLQTAVFVDGKKLMTTATVSVAIATLSGSGSGSGTGTTGGNATSYSQTTTTTQLPGGGTRTDIDHGNGSGTIIIHDPHGGPNGGSRTTTSSSDSEGNTTTTTTTTDGSDGSSTTTTTTSP